MGINCQVTFCYRFPPKVAAILNLPVGDEDQTVDAAEAVADDEAAAGLEAVAAAATVAGRA